MKSYETPNKNVLITPEPDTTDLIKDMEEFWRKLYRNSL